MKRVSPVQILATVLSLFFLGSCPLSAQQQQPQSSQSGGPSNPVAQLDANRAQTRQQAISTLTKELEGLIPTDYKPESKEFSLLRETAEQFLAGDREAVNKTVDELRKLDSQVPPNLLLLAGLSFSANRAAVAQQFMEQAAQEHPTHVAIPIAFSRVAINQGRIADALAQIEKAQRLNNQDSPANAFYRAQTADVMSVIAIRQERLEDALRYAKEWEQLEPESNKMLVTRAEIEFLNGNLDSSLQYLQKLHEQLPTSRPPEIVIASWFGRKQDMKNIDKWVKLAVEKHPQDPIVMLEYANWALGQEDFETTEQAIQSWEKLAGPSLQSSLMKGRLAFARQDYAAAEKHFESIFVSQPNNFDASNLYALSLIESSDQEKRNRARQIAQRNYQAAPNNLIAAAALGWVLHRTGNKETGRKVMTSIAQNPNAPPEFRYFFANMLFEAGNVSQAENILRPALEHKGIFLYRGAARKLLESMASSEGLPEPGK